MAVVLDGSVKIARMDATRLLFVNGSLEISDTVGFSNVLASWTLDATAGITSVDAWIVGLTSAAATVAVSGTAAYARLKNSSGTVLISGITVGGLTSGEDLELESTSLTVGQTITLTSLNFNHG